MSYMWEKRGKKKHRDKKEVIFYLLFENHFEIIYFLDTSQLKQIL